MRYADKAESLVTYTAESCIITRNPTASSKCTGYWILLNKHVHVEIYGVFFPRTLFKQ